MQLIDSLLYLLHSTTQGESSTTQEGESYHTWVSFPTIVTNHINSQAGTDKQKANSLLTAAFENDGLLELAKNKFIFFVLHSSNHWHLFAVDKDNHRFISYNSLRGPAIHKACARKWVKTYTLAHLQ